ncbi:hypothetical protein diail_3414 [Diaporthe ilicicola]|nr:hypothetical protein diail_3414 [Diaporthe ilicicola]
MNIIAILFSAVAATAAVVSRIEPCDSCDTGSAGQAIRGIAPPINDTTQNDTPPIGDPDEKVIVNLPSGPPQSPFIDTRESSPSPTKPLGISPADPLGGSPTDLPGAGPGDPPEGVYGPRDPDGKPIDDDPDCPWRKSADKLHRNWPKSTQTLWSCLKERNVLWPQVRADVSRLLGDGKLTVWDLPDECYLPFIIDWKTEEGRRDTYDVHAEFYDRYVNEIEFSRLVTDFIPYRDFTKVVQKYLGDFEIWICRP